MSSRTENCKAMKKIEFVYVLIFANKCPLIDRKLKDERVEKKSGKFKREAGKQTVW